MSRERANAIAATLLPFALRLLTRASKYVVAPIASITGWEYAQAHNWTMTATSLVVTLAVGFIASYVDRRLDEARIADAGGEP